MLMFLKENIGQSIYFARALCYNALSAKDSAHINIER